MTYPEFWLSSPAEISGRNSVQRLNGGYIYSLAVNLRPLDTIHAEIKRGDAFFLMSTAIETLKILIDGNPLGLHGCIPVGRDLNSILQEISDEIISDVSKVDEQLGPFSASKIINQWRAFEITLNADLAIANLYLTTRKGAFDTFALAEEGLSAFPSSLASKVPDAIDDAKQSARCLAFDLPTAAAFHMHRAHEIVVHAYYKAIAPSKTPPTARALEQWIKAIESESGQTKIVATLRDIKDLHRNPVLHPEQTLEDSEEAIALLGAIGTSMTHMLKAMP